MRARVNGEIYEVTEVPELDRYKMHTIEAVIDRIVVRQPQANDEARRRADRHRPDAPGDSVETALKLGNGVLIVSDVSDRDNPGRPHLQRALFLRQVRHQPARRSSRAPSASTARTAPVPPAPVWARLQEFDPELILGRGRCRWRTAPCIPWQRQNDERRRRLLPADCCSAVCKQYAIPVPRAGQAS